MCCESRHFARRARGRTSEGRDADDLTRARPRAVTRAANRACRSRQRRSRRRAHTMPGDLSASAIRRPEVAGSTSRAAAAGEAPSLRAGYDADRTFHRAHRDPMSASIPVIAGSLRPMLRSPRCCTIARVYVCNSGHDCHVNPILRRNTALFATETAVIEEYEYVFIVFIVAGNLNRIRKKPIINTTPGENIG